MIHIQGLDNQKITADKGMGIKENMVGLGLPSYLLLIALALTWPFFFRYTEDWH